MSKPAFHLLQSSAHCMDWGLLPFYIADELVTESSEERPIFLFFSFLFVATLYDLFVEKVLVFVLINVYVPVLLTIAAVSF